MENHSDLEELRFHCQVVTTPHHYQTGSPASPRSASFSPHRSPKASSPNHALVYSDSPLVYTLPPHVQAALASSPQHQATMSPLPVSSPQQISQATVFPIRLPASSSSQGHAATIYVTPQQLSQVSEQQAGLAASTTVLPVNEALTNLLTQASMSSAVAAVNHLAQTSMSSLPLSANQLKDSSGSQTNILQQRFQNFTMVIIVSWLATIIWNYVA